MLRVVHGLLFAGFVGIVCLSVYQRAHGMLAQKSLVADFDLSASMAQSLIASNVDSFQLRPPKKYGLQHTFDFTSGNCRDEYTAFDVNVFSDVQANLSATPHVPGDVVLQFMDRRFGPDDRVAIVAYALGRLMIAQMGYGAHAPRRRAIVVVVPQGCDHPSGLSWDRVWMHR